MLEEQCNTWGGITSVAVYLPLVYFQASNDNKLREAISHVENFHEQIDRTHGELSSLLRHPITPMHAMFCECSGCSGLQYSQASSDNKLREAISHVKNSHDAPTIICSPSCACVSVLCSGHMADTAGTSHCS